jgi:hypothetical protein
VFRRVCALTLAASLLFALPASTAAVADKAPPGFKEARDATVVAVLDFTFAPYHWDFVGSKMPQHQDASRSNDLPLDLAPHQWVPGFPDPGEFKSYNSLDLSLDDEEATQVVEALDAKDASKWESVKQTTGNKPHYYWMPDTKVIGAIDFGGTKIHGPTTSHGTGTASVSVGNIHGTCPECLLVFVNINSADDAERAIEWTLDQPWIDAVTNSYGFSAVSRDRFYAGSDTKLQKEASLRGQTIFFSAGNGQENAFLIPNTTLFSSQEGPDWVVTVGAVSPGAHASYTGHGKPADIAGIGSSYPAAYGSPTVGGTGSGGFGGTSNATPTIAGTYARALYLARKALGGPSRVQRNGVIATGSRFDCGSARPDCELGDGKLTVDELRTRLFHGAVHTEAGMTPGGVGALPKIGEEEFLSEGHGSYFARETGKIKDWLKEFERIMAPLEGRAKELKRPDGEKQWMIVDSFCRQHLWGGWNGGYYLDGKTKLPGYDNAYPVRSTIEQACPRLTHGPPPPPPLP